MATLTKGKPPHRAIRVGASSAGPMIAVSLTSNAASNSRADL
jgi:hypothetical protein